jgi:hypothetical protein
VKKKATVYTSNGSIALVLNSIKREGDKLVIDGNALGSMRMDMVLTPGEFFHAFKIALCWGLISFVLLLPFFGLRRLLCQRKNINST